MVPRKRKVLAAPLAPSQAEVEHCMVGACVAYPEIVANAETSRNTQCV